MKNFDEEGQGNNIKNNQKRLKQSEAKQRNSELYTLTFIIILCAAVLWYFVSNIFVDILGTVILLVLYTVLFADIVDYNRALRNVKREVSEQAAKSRQ